MFWKKNYLEEATKEIKDALLEIGKSIKECDKNQTNHFQTENTKKLYLIGKIFDEHNQELQRKESLEAKALGYYTMLGIFFAGFIIVFIEFVKIFTYINQISQGIFVFFAFMFMATFTIITQKLGGCYKPKDKEVFNIRENYFELMKYNEDIIANVLIDNFANIIPKNIKLNDSIVNSLKDVEKILPVNIGMMISLLILFFVIKSFF